MTTNTTVQLDSYADEKVAAYCKELRLPNFYKAYMEQMADPKYVTMTFSSRLIPILSAERNARVEKRNQRNYKESCINDPLPDLTRTIFDASNGWDKPLIDELASCRWLEQSPIRLNVLISGMTGSGKTWLAMCLGKEALKRGFKVLYIRAPQLIERLRDAHAANQSAQLRSKWNNKDLIIIDDFGLTPMDSVILDDFLTFITERQYYGSLIVASQVPFSGWYSYLGDNYHADAILDRWFNSSYKIELTGNSLRKAPALPKKRTTTRKTQKNP